MNFKITFANGVHGTEVWLDGERLSRVVDVRIGHRVGYLPKLEIEVRPELAEVVGETNDVAIMIGKRRFVPVPEPVEVEAAA